MSRISIACRKRKEKKGAEGWGATVRRQPAHPARNPARREQPTDILNFYHLLQAGSSPLHQAKMLLVGQGGVGKTSLVNRLLHNTCNEHEAKTEGIAIAHCQIPTAQGEIHLNIWDFGGQEIMHATHQFFLTERSLYLLVLDARQGEQEN